MKIRKEWGTGRKKRRRDRENKRKERRQEEGRVTKYTQHQELRPDTVHTELCILRSEKEQGSCASRLDNSDKMDEFLEGSNCLYSLNEEQVTYIGSIY